jgi:hypothetical protein
VVLALRAEWCLIPRPEAVTDQQFLTWTSLRLGPCPDQVRDGAPVHVEDDAASRSAAALGVPPPSLYAAAAAVERTLAQATRPKSGGDLEGEPGPQQRRLAPAA